MTRPYRGDPLRRIPPVATLRRRLNDAREVARRLAILLETAERLEREGESDEAGSSSRDKRKSKGGSP